MVLPHWPCLPGAATNFEEQKDGALADANDDLALMRFEFLEALTRVALLKFGKEEGVHDVSESVEKLLNFLKPAVPEQVAIEANVFRVRLYTEVRGGYATLILKHKIQ